MATIAVALTGNPNTGKSTIFNELTGARQKIGNWPGVTVDKKVGYARHQDRAISIVDLPGTYSLEPSSPEEEAACETISSSGYDAVVIVADAVSPERNLRFVSAVLKASQAPAVVCLNLIDEAERKGISYDVEKMTELLGVRVIPTAARSERGLDELKKAIAAAVLTPSQKRDIPCADALAANVFESCCTVSEDSDKKDRAIDAVVLSKTFGIPIMLLLLLFIFWITIVGANYPSQLLGKIFTAAGGFLRRLLLTVGCNETVVSAAVDGVFITLGWVVSVMLPPMMIFFPLFTLLEDSGLLPRIASNLDGCFCRAGAHGKQALTTAMGFGCNACAVTGCRIIDSPRERLIAILTNSLIPCNGRFPMILSMITIFLCPTNGSSFLKAVLLTAFVALSFIVSLAASKLLSVTLLRGTASSFVLELPPYRKPQVSRVIIRSICDRTIFVLLRAVTAAAPAGLLIWILANVSVGGVPLIIRFTDFLSPFALLLGLDGAILAAFLLGFPANETVLPIALMIYMSQSSLVQLPDTSGLSLILSSHGWTAVTAVCTIVFSMFHFPCSTTCITIYKETGSLKWTLFSVIYPFLIGTLMCMSISLVSSLLF